MKETNRNNRILRVFLSVMLTVVLVVSYVFVTPSMAVQSDDVAGPDVQSSQEDVSADAPSDADSDVGSEDAASQEGQDQDASGTEALKPLKEATSAKDQAGQSEEDAGWAGDEDGQDADAAEQEDVSQETAEAAAEPLQLEAKGKGYTVTLTYEEDAQIPDGAELNVSEIKPGEKEYESYYENTGNALEDNESIAFARFFDISIMVGDEEIEPAAAVDVQIKLDDIPGAKKDEIRVNHFADGEEACEEVDAEVQLSKNKKTADTVSFVADSFSVYSVVRVKEGQVTTDLDGRDFLIMNYNTNNDWGYVMTGVAQNTNMLKYTKAWIKYHEMVYAYEDPEPLILTFNLITAPDADMGITEAILNRTENKNRLYTLTTEDGKYLNANNQGLIVSDNPCAVLVTPGTGTYENMVKIGVPAGMSGSNYRINLKGNGSAGVFQTYSGNINANDWQTLMEAEYVDIQATDEKHSADKISVSEIQTGDAVVLYRSVWNDTLKKYDLLAIDGYGNLVQVTDEGGAIGWYTFSEGSVPPISSSALQWEFTVGRNADGSESGYYWLKNTETGAYLAPRALYNYDGEKTHDIILPGDGIEAGTSASFNYSMQLPGRADGEFDSKIIAWSQADGTEGLYYKDDPEAFLGIKLAKGLFGDADRFNFAKVTITEELETVPTLDSKSMGVEMMTFDYKDRKFMSDALGSDELNSISATGQVGWYVPGLVGRILNEDGIPYSTLRKDAGGNPVPLTELFGEGKEANHLFLSSAYSETGYYEYNSGLNYAYLNKDGNFTVYKQIGAPEGNRPGVRSHGHFMPYSKILETVWPNERNTVDAFEQPLSPDDSRYGDYVHQIERSPSSDGGYNYNFGVSIKADFMQPKGGLDENGNEIIFDFSGDDDLWLYVDDVLVFDLGGIHKSVSGTVNFTTGKITYRNLTARPAVSGGSIAPIPGNTIRECFKNAGVFPDGDPWDDALADEYFDGDTLKADYFGHTMKVFYLERGKNASNLHMRFNLATVKNDSVLVAKNVSGTDKQKYTDKKFYFQAFAKEDEDEPLTDAKIAVKSTGGDWEKTDEDAQTTSIIVGDKTYDNVFCLEHGQGIFIDLPGKTKYYVREIAVDPLEVANVTVNDDDESLTVTPNEGDASLNDYSTAVKNATHRRQVIFDNECRSRDLYITKTLQLKPGQRPDLSRPYQFRVKFGTDVDHLQYYSVEPYYVVKRKATEIPGGISYGDIESYYYRIDGEMVPITKRDDGKYVYTDSEGNEQVIPAKDPTDPIFDYSSQTGYIDHIPAEYTVLLKGQMPGTVFQVEETNLPQGSELVSIADEHKDGEQTFETLSEQGATILQGKMLSTGDAYVLATNLYKEGAFRIQKVSTTSKKKFLEGAKFMLYGGDPVWDDGKFEFYKKDLLTTLESNSDGFMIVQDEYYGGDVGSPNMTLGTGTYYLKETEFPEGYIGGEAIYAFTIDDEGVMEILGRVSYDEEQGKIIFNEQTNTQMGDDTTIEGITLQTGLISNIPDVRKLELTKVLPEFLDNGGEDGTVFVFELKGYKENADGEESQVWHKYVSIEFKAASAEGKTITVNEIPSGLTRLEVTEQRIANYEPEDNEYTKDAEYDDEEGLYTVSFTNHFNGGTTYEGDVINKYERQNNGYQYTQPETDRESDSHRGGHR